MTLTNETQTIDADALRARLAEMAQRARDEMAPAAAEDPRAEVERLRDRLSALHSVTRSALSEVDYLDALLARQHAILTGVANALRGDPGPLASHSHHDLAERAAAMAALLAVTQSSLEAASSGRRVTACEDIERLQRERDALRDAAREYLAACDACEEAVGAFRANVAKGDADAARESMRAGAVTIQRGDAARTRLAALVGGAP